MNIEALMAVRARYIYEGRRSLAGALLDLPDGDAFASDVDDIFTTWLGSSATLWVDTIERKIAQVIDGGSALPVSNEEAFGFAQWFASSADLSDVPNPMPRAAVLYLAKALHDCGKYASVLAAMNAILSTKSFF